MESFFAKKLYLNQVAFYTTLGTIMSVPALLQPYYSTTITSFLSLLIVGTLRGFFESCVLYEVPLERVQGKKLFELSLRTAILMTLFLSLIRPKLGFFAIPLAVLLASTIVGKMKKKLLRTQKQPSGNAAALSQKIQHTTYITYAFYAIFVPISILCATRMHLNYFYAIALGYFFGALVEELCLGTLIYKRPITLTIALSTLSWSLCYAAMAATTIWAIMACTGLAGQPATIIGIIITKLVQPLRRLYITADIEKSDAVETS